MYTTVLLLALSGTPSAATMEDLSWQTDYSTARTVARNEEKPLAVFLGSGLKGWNQLSQDGQLTKEARRILAEDYVCVYIDLDKPAGKKLGSAFEIGGGPGIVISDRTGDVQAFRHEGDLSDTKLVRYLRRYADPDLVVRRTDSNPDERTSYYAPPTYYAPQPTFYYPQPSYFGGFMGGGGGGRSC